MTEFDPAKNTESDAIPMYQLLLVDDEVHILSSLSRLFEDEDDIMVTTCECAKDGLKHLEEEECDLVISDMKMPEMDGAAFLSEVARRDRKSVV